jgi:small subunit ribosomal protein S14
MAKLAMVKKNLERKRISLQDKSKRQALKNIIMSKVSTVEERFAASIKLADLRRDGSDSRFRNRCVLTGRPRGFFGKFEMSRICLRLLANDGKLPGVIKSSW